MKSKLFKKVSAFLLAGTTVFATCVPAFALNTEDDGVGTPGTAITQVELTKEVALFNTDASQIYEPNVAYTYSIATQNPGSATIKDKNDMTATVKTGVSGLVKIQGSNKDGYTGTAGTGNANLVFGDDNSTKKATVAEGTELTSSNAQVATRNMKLVFDVTALQVSGSYPTDAAGIYRFKITDETTAAALTASGIKRNADYDPDRYLDVYVEWADSDHTTPQVYGYVLCKTTDGTNTADGTTSLVHDDSAETFIKVTGFNVASEMRSTDGSITSTADEYHTYNMQVTKTTVGSLADKFNEFPVGIVFTNSNVTSLADFYSTGDFANANLALNASGTYTANTDFSGTPSVKNGDTFTFVGLPAGTRFQIAEKNNTNDSYKVKIEDKTTDATLFREEIVEANADTGATTATALENAKGSTFETEDIQITNTLDAISPTGLLFRIAPYVCMLIAGIVLVAVFKRKDELEIA